MIDDDREKVKASVKFVLEQWVVHRKIARDSHAEVRCPNCNRMGLMNVTFIEDGDPVKITYQCRTCQAQIEHECVLGKGRIFGSKEALDCPDLERWKKECPAELAPVWKALTRRRFPDVDSYLSLEDAYAMGCACIRRIPLESWDRHPKRVGLVLSRLSEPRQPPVYWIPSSFLRMARATGLPKMNMTRPGVRWDSGMFMLPEGELFSPFDGACPFIGFAWQRAGKYYFFDHPLESMLSLVDKFVVWTACPKTNTMFSAELNLGGSLDKISLDFMQRPKERDDGIFCHALIKIGIKLSLLLQHHPELVDVGDRMTTTNIYEPNWLGRDYRREAGQPLLGAGEQLPLDRPDALAS